MGQITYANKVALNVNPEIAAINKVQDTDMNEIKQVVNDNYNNTIQISNTQPSDSDWKIWIDSDKQTDNTYYNDNGTATQFKATTYDTLPVGTEVDYDGNTVPTGWTEIADIQPGVYSTAETICGTWLGKPLYRKVLIFPNGTGQTTLKAYTLSDYGITNVDEIFIVHPSFYTLSNRTYPFQYNDGTNAFECNVGTTQLNVLLKYADIANSKFVITLEYTKTTD